jgi:hypothetical protein
VSNRCSRRVETRRTGKPFRVASPHCSGVPLSEDPSSVSRSPVTRPVPPPRGVPIPKERRETPHPVAFPCQWSLGDPCRAFSARRRRPWSEDRGSETAGAVDGPAEAGGIGPRASRCRSVGARALPVPSPASRRGFRRTRRRDGELPVAPLRCSMPEGARTVRRAIPGRLRLALRRLETAAPVATETARGRRRVSFGRSRHWRGRSRSGDCRPRLVSSQALPGLRQRMPRLLRSRVNHRPSHGFVHVKDRAE